MTLRVVHVASGREWRGGQRQVALLAAELARRPDLEQTVVTGPGTLADRLRTTGVPVTTVPWRAGLDPRVLPGLLRAARGADLLHAHDGHALTLTGLAGQLTARPYVATRRVIFPLRHRGFWAGASRVIAISQAVHRQLVADGIDGARLVVVPSAVDLEHLATVRPAPLRRQLGLPEGARLVMCVAALEPEKGHDTLVSAARALRPAHPRLHWALAGEGGQRPAIEAAIAAGGLGDTVHLLGHQPDPAPLIAAADCLILTSSAEGLGSALLEAMALGVPVVGTRVGGIPELLADGAGTIVPPGDPSALARALLELLENPARRQQQVERAQRAVTRYGAAGMAEGVLSVYRSVSP